MIEPRHMDVCHFVIIECSHLLNGCTIKCGCIGLMLFQYLSSLGAIMCHINTGVVSVYACRVCDALVASGATAHQASMNQITHDFHTVPVRR